MPCYKAKIAATSKVYSESNKERLKAVSDEYRTLNRERLLISNRAYYHQNRATLLAKVKAHAAKNKKAKALYDAQYRILNKSRRNANESKRRATMLCATPTWASELKILEFYETAAGLRMLLGAFYSVDHIVPLQSALVCGLHCEHNLQVVTREENSCKGNRFWPDMWEQE